MGETPREFQGLRDSPQRLVLDIQALQMRAHKLGLHITGRAINNAMNVCGWEQAGDADAASKAMHGERTK